MLLHEPEQRPLYQATNFSLQITDPGSVTVRTATLSTFLCPSNTGFGPVVAASLVGSIVSTDVSAGQYVASAGQLEPGKFPEDLESGRLGGDRHASHDTAPAGRPVLPVADACQKSLGDHHQPQYRAKPQSESLRDLRS